MSPIPPTLDTATFEQLVLEAFTLINGIDYQKPILDTADYRHRVLYALQYMVLNPAIDGSTGATGATGVGDQGATGATGATGPAPDTLSFVQKSGDTMTGKLTLPASTAESAGLNIGNGMTSDTNLHGDIWMIGNILRYYGTARRDVAVTNASNIFASGQAINGASTTPALRVTQTGTGEALRVEDETTPDTTAFVVSNAGKVGIGVTPDASVCLSVDITGIKYGDTTVQTTAATYCLTLGHSSSTLAAGGTNAYFSNIFDLAPVATYDRRQFAVHRDGVIVSASLSFYNGGGATPAGHSGATMSLYDVTANATVAPLVSYNVDGVASLNSASFLATGLNIPIVGGTLYNIYLQAGTFTTNPTSVRQTINLFIR